MELPVSEESILRFHRLARGDIWDAGKYKEKEVDIIETYPDGRSRVRFKTVAATDTPTCMKELVELYGDAVKERIIPPLVLLAAFNLDLLCIHPFRDGNGRISRLLLLLQCYHLGYEAGRYINLERLIEQNNECPDVSVDMIRRVLKNLRARKQVECLGRGQNAQRQKTGKWQLGNIP